MDPTERLQLQKFVWLGYVVGGLVPTFLPLVLQLNTAYRLIPDRHVSLYTSGVAVFVLLVTPLLFGALVIQETRPRDSRWLRTIAAAISIGALSLFVWLTGGPTDSPFAFSFLYISSVVVASFRDKTTWLCTGVACFTGYLITLFYPAPDGGVQWAHIQDSVSYQGTSALIFLIQLLVVIVIPMSQPSSPPLAIEPVPTLSHPGAQRIGWYLFDFGNSLLIAAGALYFGPWLTDMRINVAWLTVAVGISSVVSLCLGPVLGRLLDEGLPPRRILVVCSLAMALGTLMLCLLATAHISGLLLAIVACVAFVMLFSAYQLSLVPYNALLRPLAGAESMDRVSGVGLIWNSVGMILGAVLTLPFVGGPWQWAPQLARGQAFLPSLIMYSAVTIVSLLLINETARVSTVDVGSLTVRVKDVIRVVSSQRDLLYFGLFFLLFSDALITLETNASAVMTAIGGLSDSRRSLVLVTTLLCAIIASYGVARVAAKAKAPNRPMWMLFGAIPAAVGPVLLTLIPQPWMLWIALPLTGVSAGVVRTIARAHYSAIAPRHQLGSVVGVYSSLERAGAVLGPLTWSLALFATGGSLFGYRIGLGFAAFFVAAALYFLKQAQLSTSLEVAP